MKTITQNRRHFLVSTGLAIVAMPPIETNKPNAIELIAMLCALYRKGDAVKRAGIRRFLNHHPFVPKARETAKKLAACLVEEYGI